jgi:hypothetical protein
MNAPTSIRDLSPKSIAQRVEAAAQGDKTAIPTWRRLKAPQKAFWAPHSAKEFEALSDANKVCFALVTLRMSAAGLDYSSLQLAQIRPAGLIMLARDKNHRRALAKFEKSIQQAIDKGTLMPAGAFEPFHGKTTIAARENRRTDGLHLGVGLEEVFVHLDEYNPRCGPEELALHTKELIELGLGRSPDPRVIAKRLGIEFFRSFKTTNVGRIPVTLPALRTGHKNIDG